MRINRGYYASKEMTPVTQEIIDEEENSGKKTRKDHVPEPNIY